MALARMSAPIGTEWEVDASGVVIVPTPDGWQVIPGLGAPSGTEAYLGRHGLYRRYFSTLSRAVDSVRLALSEEPWHKEIRTRWRKEAEGRYFSRCGHWRLQQEEREDCLFPRTDLARKALLQQGSLPTPLPTPSYTLRCNAERVDRLNRLLELEPVETTD